MLLHGSLAGAGDDDDLLQSGGDGLLYGVLDDGRIEEREQLLGLRLGRGKEPGTQAGGQDHRLAYAHRAGASQFRLIACLFYLRPGVAATSGARGVRRRARDARALREEAALPAAAPGLPSPSRRRCRPVPGHRR